MCIQIKIGKATKTFNDKLEAVAFIMSKNKHVSKPIKVTKKYTLWRDVEDFLRSVGQ